MSYSSRIFMYGPVALLVLVAVLYSVFWRVEADTLSARLDRANGGDIIPGVAFTYEQKSVGGFPFRLDAVLSGVSFKYRNGSTDADWRSDRIALHRMAYGRSQFIFEADGTQAVSWSTTPGAAAETISFTPETARASAILTQGRLVRVDLDVWGARGAAATSARESTAFSAGRAQLHLLARRNGTLDMVMQIENGQTGSATGASASQPALPQIDCRAQLDHADLLTAVENGDEDPSAALQRWRDVMGAINVSSLALNWPDGHAVLRGILSLDAGDRLAGALRGEWLGRDRTTRPMELVFAHGVSAFDPPSGSKRPG